MCVWGRGGLNSEDKNMDFIIIVRTFLGNEEISPGAHNLKGLFAGLGPG